MSHGRRGKTGHRRPPPMDLGILPIEPAETDAPANVADEAQTSPATPTDTPPARLALGRDLPTALTPQEVRREQWRTAGARRRARVKAAKGLGWAFPEDVPRGLGDNPGSGRPAAVVDEPGHRMTVTRHVVDGVEVIEEEHTMTDQFMRDGLAAIDAVRERGDDT